MRERKSTQWPPIQYALIIPALPGGPKSNSRSQWYLDTLLSVGILQPIDRN